MTYLYSVWKSLTSPLRVKSIILLILILFSTILEVLGIGLIVPVTLFLIEDDIFSKYPSLYIVVNYFFTNPDKIDFIKFGLIILLLVYFLKNSFLTFFAYYESKFVHGVKSSISNRLFKYYLNQDLSFHNKINSARLINNLTKEIPVFSNALMHMLILITEIFGNYDIGDEIVAYSKNVVVGAVRIAELSTNIALTAWGNLNEYGIESTGFEKGDKIELKLWRQTDNKELELNTFLDNEHYGASPFSIGKVEIIESINMPTTFSLEQNYPNPFNPNTMISFNLNEQNENTRLNIYDINGNHVISLLDGFMSEGYHSVEWNAVDKYGSNVPAGIYFYSLQAGNIVFTRKMILLK